MKKVIITGANGFVGFALTNYLLSQNVKVIAFVRKASFSQFETNVNLTLIDIANFENEIFNDVDCIYHLAWAGAYERVFNSNIFEENLNLSIKLLKFAEQIQAKKFIFASSIAEMEYLTHLKSIYDTQNINQPYAQYKLTIDLLLKSLSKIDYLPISITSIFGLGRKDLINNTLINNTLINIKNNQPLKFSKADQFFDFIYIKDAVKLLALIGEKGKANRRYILGSGKAKPLKEFLEEVFTITDFKNEVDFGFYKVQAYLPLEAFDMSEVFADLGEFEYQYSFEEGIKEMWDGMQ